MSIAPRQSGGTSYVLPSMPPGRYPSDRRKPSSHSQQQVLQDIDPLHFEVRLGNGPVQWLQVHYRVEGLILLGY